MASAVAPGGGSGGLPPEAESFLLWRPKEVANLAHFWKKSNHTFGFTGCQGLFQAILESVKWLLNWLLCTEYDQSALQWRGALKEIGRFYTRQEKTPKMFSISGGGFSPVSPLLRTPLPWDDKHPVDTVVIETDVAQLLQHGNTCKQWRRSVEIYGEGWSVTSSHQTV